MCTMYLQDRFILQGMEYITDSKFRQNTFNQHTLGTHMHSCPPACMIYKKVTPYLDMFHTRMIIFNPSSFQYIIQPSTRPCCITNSCWSPGESFYCLHLHSSYYMSWWHQFSNFNQATQLSPETFQCFQGNIQCVQDTVKVGPV
jgi:hypothetical protein